MFVTLKLRRLRHVSRRLSRSLHHPQPRRAAGNFDFIEVLTKFCWYILRIKQFAVHFAPLWYNIDMNTCQHCKAEFPAPRRHPDQKFCSTSCRDAARTFRVVASCKWCGKQFERHRYRAERFDNAYCSRECNTAATSKKQRLACGTCGKEILRSPAHVYSYNFCDSVCRAEWQRTSGYTEGANSATWRGGHDDYRGPNWESQRQTALQRDNFLCQRCGSDDLLQVHHKTPYALFDDYLEANHIDNLVSLCMTCHTTVEWEYRRSLTTTPS